MTVEMRVRAVNDAPIASSGRYVLYWMIAARRAGSNFALDRAIAHARGSSVGRCWCSRRCALDYPWASARIHQFVLDGMLDNARAFDQPGVALSTLSRTGGRAGGRAAGGAGRPTPPWSSPTTSPLLPAAHGRRARRAGARVRLEAVDGNGLLPLRAADRAFPTAYAFRRHLQQTLAGAPRRRAASRSVRGSACPARAGAAGRRGDALARRLRLARARRTPGAAADRPCRGADAPCAAAPARRGAGWRPSSPRDLAATSTIATTPTPTSAAACRRTCTSGISSPHEVFTAVMRREGWLGVVAAGRRRRAAGLVGRIAGGRGVPRSARHVARARLQHVRRPRRLRPVRVAAGVGAARRSRVMPPTDAPHLYTPRRSSTRAATHDPLWNAAQRQLRARRPHAQLPADAVGQEDPRMVADRRRTRWRR